MKSHEISQNLADYHLKSKNSLKRDDARNVQACLSKILKISISFFKLCLDKNFQIHLVSKKPEIL